MTGYLNCSALIFYEIKVLRDFLNKLGYVKRQFIKIC